jgi:Spy/CpxP family protein refolding chaperone
MARASVLMLVVGSVVVSAVSAQVPKTDPANRFLRIVPVPEDYLLAFPSVQEELKITSAQKSRLDEIGANFRSESDRLEKQRQDGLQELGDQPDPQALADFQRKVRVSGVALDDQKVASMMKALDGPQRVRLEQIRLQAEGPFAFTRPELQRRLNLSDDQIALLTTIIRDGRQEARQVLGRASDVLANAAILGPGPVLKVDPAQRDAVKSAFEKSQKEAAKLRGSLDRTIAKALTRKQRETYQKLLGEPFDLTKLSADFRKAWVAPAQAQSESKKEAERPAPK